VGNFGFAYDCTPSGAAKSSAELEYQLDEKDSNRDTVVMF
jgi:hypothetical protein